MSALATMDKTEVLDVPLLVSEAWEVKTRIEYAQKILTSSKQQANEAHLEDVSISFRYVNLAIEELSKAVALLGGKQL